MAQNDGRGNLEISNMQLLFIRILFLAQMEGSVKWAQNFSFEVPPYQKSLAATHLTHLRLCAASSHLNTQDVLSIVRSQLGSGQP